MASARIRTAILCVLLVGLFAPASIPRPSFAASSPGTIPAFDAALAGPQSEGKGLCAGTGASQAVGQPGDSDSRPGGLNLLTTDVLTYYLYLPLTLKCYGLCGACVPDGGGGTEVITTVSSSCLAAEIRIDLHERETDYGFSLWEVEAYAPGDPGMTNNLLAGAECCASSVEGGNPVWECDRALDGLMSTRWSSDWSEPHWLAIVLPEPKAVKYVVLKWETAYATQYQVNVVGERDSCP